MLFCVVGRLTSVASRLPRGCICHDPRTLQFCACQQIGLYVRPYREGISKTHTKIRLLNNKMDAQGPQSAPMVSLPSRHQNRSTIGPTLYFLLAPFILCNISESSLGSRSESSRNRGRRRSSGLTSFLKYKLPICENGPHSNLFSTANRSLKHAVTWPL